ncbi:MAG: AAA family ATPase, partial [Candidatus Odinarchaeota archaeon]
MISINRAEHRPRPRGVVFAYVPAINVLSWLERDCFRSRARSWRVSAGVSSNFKRISQMIKRIQIQDYRSCLDTSFDFHPNLSVLIGPNGSGKTNIL